MSDLVMPRLTDSMEEGVILGWLREDGDLIEVGDDLVEIETDKASMVYESDLAGVLEILVPEGETRAVGEPIARIGADGADGPGEALAEKTKAATQPEAPAVDGGEPVQERPAPPPSPPSPAPTPPAPPGERLRISPLAARIAREKGIDVSGIQGSGPNGRIVKADLDRAGVAAAPVPAPARPEAGPTPGPSSSEATKGEVEIVELDRIQQTIARRMAESKATAPHFYLRAEVDMTRAVEVREAFKALPDGDQVVPSLNDMIVKATALALRHHPRANGTYRDGRLELHSRINLGIAVAAGHSLIVPVLPDADRLDLREIAQLSRRLAERVRTGEVTPPELAGATFTISNLGMYGIRDFDAVINPGHAAILAVGEISDRPAVRDGEVVPAKLMDLSLACDHRILYGADAAEFLAEIKANLEEPGLLA